jgi:hypothetical protein
MATPCHTPRFGLMHRESCDQQINIQDIREKNHFQNYCRFGVLMDFISMDVWQEVAMDCLKYH